MTAYVWKASVPGLPVLFTRQLTWAVVEKNLVVISSHGMLLTYGLTFLAKVPLIPLFNFPLSHVG